ncbi:hypothetical protein [Streptomyces cavernae]|uniref:hypothetical protein n=1 Tax=Streptomyces cavernae TaxID=2259034 RepID=UPI000FEBA29B|nr:hypothetical protein [Streptomyces cavernae]
MAKNKNREREPKKSRSSQAGQAQEPARTTTTEDRQSPMSSGQGSPADMARRQQKRFGHN